MPQSSQMQCNPQLDRQMAWMSESVDLASRNMERLMTTQLDGCRDWMHAVSGQTRPQQRLTQHFAHGLQLGCALFVAQVSALTDAMQLVERTVAEQQRELLADLSRQPEPLSTPFRRVLCFSGCAFDSLSKASRQVANFASNRFAAAAVSAVQQARDRLTEHP